MEYAPTHILVIVLGWPISNHKNKVIFSPFHFHVHYQIYWQLPLATPLERFEQPVTISCVQIITSLKWYSTLFLRYCSQSMSYSRMRNESNIVWKNVVSRWLEAVNVLLSSSANCCVSECPEIHLSDLGVWPCLGNVWDQDTLWSQVCQTEIIPTWQAPDRHIHRQFQVMTRVKFSPIRPIEWVICTGTQKFILRVHNVVYMN